MDQEDIQGMMEDEVIDDGEFDLRANQADMKCHALAKSTQFTEEEAKGIHGMDDVESEHERKVTGNEDSENESEQSDDGFQFQPSSLLHTGQDDDMLRNKYHPGQRKKETHQSSAPNIRHLPNQLPKETLQSPEPFTQPLVMTSVTVSHHLQNCIGKTPEKLLRKHGWPALVVKG